MAFFLLYIFSIPNSHSTTYVYHLLVFREFTHGCWRSLFDILRGGRSHCSSCAAYMYRTCGGKVIRHASTGSRTNHQEDALNTPLVSSLRTMLNSSRLCLSIEMFPTMRTIACYNIRHGKLSEMGIYTVSSVHTEHVHQLQIALSEIFGNHRHLNMAWSTMWTGVILIWTVTFIIVTVGAIEYYGRRE